MKEIFAVGYYSATTNGYLFYCFNTKQGAYLSKDIKEAYNFMSLESARRDATRLMKYFWSYPMSYTILKGTKN